MKFLIPTPPASGMATVVGEVSTVRPTRVPLILSTHGVVGQDVALLYFRAKHLSNAENILHFYRNGDELDIQQHAIVQELAQTTGKLKVQSGTLIVPINGDPDEQIYPAHKIQPTHPTLVFLMGVWRGQTVGVL